MGAAIGGVAGLVLAARGLARNAGATGPLIVGGVNLSGVDLSRPFMVDFSVPPSATPDAKRTALANMRSSWMALIDRFPMWTYDPDVDASSGRFVLKVTPTTPEQRVMKALGGT